jgi:pimeloyl-ACP methyl ester carboxylesterase
MHFGDLQMRTVRTDLLDVGYVEVGDPSGRAIVLLHGFPYDIRAYSEVSGILGPKGFRVLIPYLRGFGQTRFLSRETIRSGEQSSLGLDLIAFLDAMKIERAILGGYDWGGRAACIAAALHPERVAGLVSGGGYNIQRIAGTANPLPPETEQRYWYQYYFHGERGRNGLETYRRELCRLLWRQWSPGWAFDDSTFERSAESFDNPDFVSVVVHSYRHRFGLVDGDPRYERTALALEALPPVTVPTIVVEGAMDGVTPRGSYDHLDLKFTGAFERRVFERAGHNMPQESPQEFAEAILTLAKGTRH